MRANKLIRNAVFFGCITGALCATAAPPTDLPYYEKDAWYDITEWFDGNDYNPTDETFQRINDEKYDAIEDNGTDGKGSVFSGNAGTSVDDWSYSWSDVGNPYFYENNEEAGVKSFGYYHDYDKDGFYDAYSSYRNVNGDGAWDETSYYSFNGTSRTAKSNIDSSASAPGSKTRFSDRGKESEQRRGGASATTMNLRTVSGSVEKTKEVQTRDGKHLVIAIRREQQGRTNAQTRPASAGEGTRQDQFLAVDLGKLSDVSYLNIRQGQPISVEGVTTNIGDQTVMLARSIGYDGRTHTVQWQSRQLTGKVLSTHTANVRGRENRFAMVQLDGSGGKVAVDFGRVDRLQTRINKGDSITFSGVPIKAGDQRLLLAQQIRLQGESRQIDRSDNAASESRNDETSHFPKSAPVIHGADVSNADDETSSEESVKP